MKISGLHTPVMRGSVEWVFFRLYTEEGLVGLRHFPVLEFHAQDIAWRDGSVAGHGPLIEEGCIEQRHKLALAIDLNAEVARVHLQPGATFFATGGH